MSQRPRAKKSRKPKTTPITLHLHENEAALIFMRDCTRMLLPEETEPHVALAIALAMRMRDPEWVALQMRWLDEMERLGQEPEEGRQHRAAMEGVSHAVH